MEEPLVNIRELICRCNSYGDEKFDINNASEFFKSKLYASIPSYTNLDSFLGVEVRLKCYSDNDGWAELDVEFYGIRPETINESVKRKKEEARNLKQQRALELRSKKQKERGKRKKLQGEREVYERLKKKFDDIQ